MYSKILQSNISNDTSFLELLPFLFLVYCLHSTLVLPIRCSFSVALIAQLVKNLPAMRETPVRSLGWECGTDSSVGKESTCTAGDPGLNPGLGRYPGEGKDYPLQYSGLENSKDYIHRQGQT